MFSLEGQEICFGSTAFKMGCHSCTCDSNGDNAICDDQCEEKQEDDSDQCKL